MSQTAPLVKRELTYHERNRGGGGPKTAQDHADIVAACLDSAVEHILHAGEILHQAKSKLEHGDWARMFRDHQTPVARPLPFGIRTAQRLMKISEVFSGSGATHVSCLPTAWGTLYELARLPQPILMRAFDEGQISPAMQRSHVKAMLVRMGVHKKPLPPPVGADDGLEDRDEWGELGEEERRQRLADAAQSFGLVLDPDITEAVVRSGAAAPPWAYGVAAARIREAVEREVSQTSAPDAWPALADLLRSLATEIDGMVGTSKENTSEPVAPYRCQSCDRTLEEEELAEVRECSSESCGERFDAAVDGRNCPSCNRAFTRLITDRGCPDCLDEAGEVVEAAVALEGGR
jgi:hypothetical protein